MLIPSKHDAYMHSHAQLLITACLVHFAPSLTQQEIQNPMRTESPLLHFKFHSLRHTLVSSSFLVISLFLLLFLLLHLITSKDNISFNPLNAQINLLHHHQCRPLASSASCTKTPPSLSQALLHYATSNTTPQQTLREISVTERVLRRKSPCNFLVFGLGHDSVLWSALNYGGRTVFVEEDRHWMELIQGQFRELEAYHAVYHTKVSQAEKLLRVAQEGRECEAVVDPRQSKCGLALKELPKEVYEVEWDLIMVDAPTGYHAEAPGRMTVIYTAGLLARNRKDCETDVFVHDVDRVVEDTFSKAFLCQGYLKEQEWRLRHFTIPSHKAQPGRPFCPR